MRENKFKVWDKENGCWFQPIFKAYAREIEELLLTPEGELILRRYDRMEHESLFPNRFEKVWYTGLKDKNGREIYEGDILEIRTFGFDPEHFITYIKFENCSFKLANNRALFYFGQKDLTKFDDGLVIGNIYENKDLLEGEK